MGGGFALARSLEESGLSKRLGLALQGLSHLPPELILAISIFVGMLITQFASNTGTAALLTPILAAVGAGIQLNPVYLMVPLVIGCSYPQRLAQITPNV
jgi:solute carrier family 13 (sodium-dependent dicarboxylate transporter), member 2/3/5